MIAGRGGCPTTIPVRFTICLFISPDLDGHRAPKMKYCPRRGHCLTLSSKYMFHDMFIYPLIRTKPYAICFTICLCISPDLDGYRAPKKSINPERPRKRESLMYGNRQLRNITQTVRERKFNVWEPYANERKFNVWVRCLSEAGLILR